MEPARGDALGRQHLSMWRGALAERGMASYLGVASWQR